MNDKQAGELIKVAETIADASSEQSYTLESINLQMQEIQKLLKELIRAVKN